MSFCQVSLVMRMGMGADVFAGMRKTGRRTPKWFLGKYFLTSTSYLSDLEEFIQCFDIHTASHRWIISQEFADHCCILLRNNKNLLGQKARELCDYFRITFFNRTVARFSGYFIHMIQTKTKTKPSAGVR